METFDQREIRRHFSYVCPSRVITIASERGIETGLYLFTGSGTSHEDQTGIPGSWAHGKCDSHQIFLFKLVYQLLITLPKIILITGPDTSHSVHRVGYLSYKSNRYTGPLSAWKVRFVPNLILKLVLTCSSCFSL